MREYEPNGYCGTGGPNGIGYGAGGGGGGAGPNCPNSMHGTSSGAGAPGYVRVAWVGW